MKEVTYAVLHEPVFIPGAGEFGRTLTNGPTGKTRDLKMELTADGLLLKLTAKGVEAYIPVVSLKVFTLAK